MKVVSELSGEACDEGSGECGDRMVRIARIMLAEKNLFEHVRLFVKCVESFEAAWRQKNT